MSFKAKAIMFLGTGSDVGKSICVTAFCRILKRRGYRVAPFKAQNMSNNSYVTLEGGEIGRAQVVQAEAAGLIPGVDMNPILLKPSGMRRSQVVVRGKVDEEMSALEYHRYKKRLKQVVLASYERLSQKYDVIVMEGAGSCCEMNLKDNDLVNFSMAESVGARAVIVADIDRGGVFAQIIGTYHLMNRKERALTMGFLINKFRGDPGLFLSGIEYIEKKTGKPVLGLVPYFQDIIIDTEDSVAVQEDKRKYTPPSRNTVNIGIIRLPAISNFTDFEILEREPDVIVNYLSRPSELKDEYDILVIPGTKNVINDGKWLKSRRWSNAIRRFKQKGGIIIGVCGGYQLLGDRIHDPYRVESDGGSIKGLGLLPVETVLEQDKIVRKVIGVCPFYDSSIRGYEIHMGRSYMKNNYIPFAEIHEPGKRKSWEDGAISDDGLIMGTYIHGLFDSTAFREKILNIIRAKKSLRPRRSKAGRLSRFRQYDRLADHFEAHCDVDRILKLAGIEK